MDGTVLPAVRIPTVPAGQGEDGQSSQQETPLVDLPPSEKFGFAWPDSAATVNPTSSSVLGSLPILPSTESTSETSDVDSSEPEPEPPLSKGHSSPVLERDFTEQQLTPSVESSESNPTPIPRSPPRLSRAFSMPLPSQLGHLKNPYRSGVATPYPPPSPLVLANSPNSSQFHDLSVELADSVQMVIQTLLQISPPHLLDPAKEQFSACSLSVPSPSISAMLTTMKNLNYMSANMPSFTLSGPLDTISEMDLPGSNSNIHDEFDVGEVLQSVGDALSGLASQAGVDLVLFHADVGMKHVSVKGDECGISYALTHLIRQIMDTAQSGDTIEIGLFITVERTVSPDSRGASDAGDESRSSSRASSAIPDFDGPIRCTFDVSHKFFTGDSVVSSLDSERTISSSSPSPAPSRTRPNFDSLMLRRLLRRINGTLTPDLTPRLFSPGRSTELSVLVEAGSPDLLARLPQLTPEEESARQPFANANIQLATEPSLEELFLFLETLKGKKVALYASGKGSFAHHMTSYLTAWGLDVSHMSSIVPRRDPESPEDSTKERRPSAGALSSELSRVSALALAALSESPAAMEKAEVDPLEQQLRAETDADGIVRSAAFIIIDDDVDALRQQLTQLRSEAPYNGSTGTNMKLKLNPSIASRRPNLSALHRPKSSPQIARAKLAKMNQQQVALPPPPPVIIHFTSLSNYKLVKDVINSVLASPLPNSSHSSASTAHASSSNYGPSTPIPEVIVIPKPAGPRRLLVALRTALTKPIVDPFFTPIATSPMSPTTGFGFSGGSMSPFALWGHATGWNQDRNGHSGHPSSYAQRGTGRPPVSPRTASDRSQRSTGVSKDSGEHMHGFMPAHRGGLPPSPLGQPDTMEYFSEAAMKLGTSPSSGLVIQSPDGQPAGIFFHPRGAGNRTLRGGRENIGTIGTTTIQPPSLVRDTGNLRPPGEPYRQTPRRNNADGESGPGRPPVNRQRSSLSRRNPEAAYAYGDTQGAPLSAFAAATALASRTRRPTGTSERGGSQSSVQTTANMSSSTSNPNVTPLEIPSPTQSTSSPRQGAGDVLNWRTSSSSSMSAQRLANASSHMSGASPSGSPVAAGPPSASPGGASGQIPSPTSAQPKRPAARRLADLPDASKKGKSIMDNNNIVPPVNVLIVEDNPINQTILSTFMRKKKIKYDVAKNGAEAVTKWKTGGFHLILMDIQMPIMDGIEATKEIRRLERLTAFGNTPSTPLQEGPRTPSEAASTESVRSAGAHTPYSSSVIIVALTASSLQTDRVAALAAGCNDFLTKPVSLLWLNSKIIEWGSIKALQMWADHRPDVVKNITMGQVAQARTIASKLQLPESRKASQANSAGSAIQTEPESVATKPTEPSSPQAPERTETSSGHAQMPAGQPSQDGDSSETVGERAQSPGTENPCSDTSSDNPTVSETNSNPTIQTPHQSPLKPPRQISGKQALLAHLRSFYGNKQNESQRPIILGERASTSAVQTIAEVMHIPGSAGPSSDNSGTPSPGLVSTEPLFIPEVDVNTDSGGGRETPLAQH